MPPYVQVAGRELATQFEEMRRKSRPSC